MTDRRLTLHPGAVAMTIAGSDPSGGAGLQADLKAFEQNSVFGQAVVTLLTVQNTTGIERIEVLDKQLIADQIMAAANDIPPRAIKTGALGTAEVVRHLAEVLESLGTTLVVDPVLVSKSGDSLAGDDVVAAYRDTLMPLCDLFTPNRHEASRLVGRKLTSADDCGDAAAELFEMGPRNVLVKAGRFDDVQLHYFACEGGVQRIEIDPIDSDQTHGAGCCLSAVATARLAIAPGPHNSETILAACQFAIPAVHHAITLAPGLGQGRGPVEFAALRFGD